MKNVINDERIFNSTCEMQQAGKQNQVCDDLNDNDGLFSDYLRSAFLCPFDKKTVNEIKHKQDKGKNVQFGSTYGNMQYSGGNISCNNHA